ncbi:MAG: EthD domain-containing protein [Sandaracinobacteroides sp.]
MIKLVYCIARRADVSAADFHRYWLEEHGPKVKAVAATIGASRYVQSHSIAPGMNAAFKASRGLADGYDGITEVWFESEAALEKALGSPEGQAAGAMLIADESTFIDFARSSVFLTREHPIF